MNQTGGHVMGEKPHNVMDWGTVVKEHGRKQVRKETLGQLSKEERQRYRWLEDEYRTLTEALDGIDLLAAVPHGPVSKTSLARGQKALVTILHALSPYRPLDEDLMDVDPFDEDAPSRYLLDALDRHNIGVHDGRTTHKQAIATTPEKGVWWQARAVAQHTVDVVRLRNGRPTGLCYMRLWDDYGVPMLLDDGTLRADWAEHVYYFARTRGITDQAQVLAAIPAPSTMTHHTFKPRRALQDNERPFKAHACHQCGQRALVYNPDIYGMGGVICLVCGSQVDFTDTLIYPHIARAKEAYDLERRAAEGNALFPFGQPS